MIAPPTSAHSTDTPPYLISPASFDEVRIDSFPVDWSSEKKTTKSVKAKSLSGSFQPKFKVNTKSASRKKASFKHC